MKERICNFFWNAACYTLGVTIAALLVYEVVSVSDYIPRWLGDVAPAVVVDSAWGSYRDKDISAFTVAAHKVGKGTPITPLFHVQAYGDAYSPEIGLSVHRCKNDNSRLSGPLPTHPIGQSWLTRYCFDIPGTIGVHDRMWVSGYIVHSRWFGVVHEPVPGFAIEPMAEGSTHLPPQ